MYETNPYFYGTGRRKESVARVRVYAGTGKITINDRDIDDYFGLGTLKLIVRQPLNLTETAEKFDIEKSRILNKRSSYEGKKEIWSQGSSPCTTVLKEIICSFYKPQAYTA